MNDINCDNFSQNTVIQTLTINSIPIIQFSPTLCPGEVEIVNGVVYDEDNPNGTETIIGGSFFDCDSIVEVNLIYHTPAELNVIESLCEDESRTYNGVIYDINNPIGTEILMDASQTNILPRISFLF